ncbi:hypothetical protein LS482_08210 [Sinomicrobium kalidii]|uniref:hypothetical protein n=1 Tax=Sinomicrobium kalidii TaxID=2900738 RepID=UPI001E54BB5D|nr:hypothetical protein [Sinomicrobium kalidii]UGU17852.1 hypothetical protein LS482_08210 [Sinomicrobium kalidii]
MKKIYVLINFCLFGFLINSCSTNGDNALDDEEPPEESLEISVTSASQTYEIDKSIEFVITCEENMRSVGITRYTISSSGDTLPYTKTLSGMDDAPDNLGKEISIYTGFMFPGENKVGFTVESVDGKFIEKTLNINVAKGSAVKVKSFEVLSFYGKKEVWDAESPENAPYTLTNFLSLLSKDAYLISFEGQSLQRSTNEWHRPEEKKKGETLFWDLEDRNLYIGTSARFSIDISGYDTEGISRSLLEYWPSEEYYTFQDYAETKPDTVKIRGDGGNLEVIFTLEW